MRIVKPSPAALADFWAGFATATGAEGQPVDVFAFGDSSDMADELAALVLAGTKRATAAARAEYDAEGLVPKVGDLSVVHLADGTPVAVIRTTDVHVGPLTSVTDDFAWQEGEGERTRAWWIAAHQAYFRRSLGAAGLPYDDHLDVVFERFELVWPTR